MPVNYKIVCEVKLLHEYYLTGKDGSSIFSLASQADRLRFLENRFSFGYPCVDDHLAYEPAYPGFFTNARLRIIPSYSGFKLFIDAKEQMLPGNIRAYRPLLPPDNNMPLMIRLRKKDTLLNSFSNARPGRSLPALYYFTSRGLGTAKLSPVLSAALPLRDDTQVYEQGELVFDTGDNKVKAFYYERNGTKNWMAVTANGYVNANDLSLVPTRFHYAFAQNDAVSDASFVLKDAGGAVISTINRTGTAPLTKVTLDYSQLVTALLDETGAAPQPHTLEVTATGGYKKIHSVLFCDAGLLRPDDWGLIDLRPVVADPLFNLLDVDGLLITRKNPDGTAVPHPVFEIRIKSRFAFWRYSHNKDKKLQDNPALHPFLVYDAAGGYMETIGMKNSSYTPVEFIHMGVPKYLPNPEMNNPLLMERQRVYTDIRVPESDLFKSI